MSNTPEDYSTSPLPALPDEAATISPSLTDPMTPPTTPPTCDLSASPTSTQGGRGGNPWKRMRYSFGWRRRTDSHSDGTQSPNSVQGGRNSAEH
jgi:hypothetical protein